MARKKFSYNVSRCLVCKDKKFGESFLQTLIQNKVIPKNFSGVMTPKFGNHILCLQFDKNKLVGELIIHVDNMKQFIDKLAEAPVSQDWIQVFNNVQEEESVGE